MKIVYKVMTPAEWEGAKHKGVYFGSVADARDKFIHLSTREQTEETVARHFSETAELILLAVNADDLGVALRWEISRGGDLFPHLFAPLQVGDILWAKPFATGKFGDLRKLLAE